MSLLFTTFSEIVISNVNVIIGILLLIIFILLGIIFDMIGVSVTAADIAPFNSMNSRKIKGANIAVIFKKNADKVSSFCNDVVGDICGIVSGSAGSIIALSIANAFKINKFYVTLIVTALVASLTIGGKALGKGLAINKSNTILYKFSKFVSYFYKK
jgi:CBS domain containing-hemolysin-like protein